MKDGECCEQDQDTLEEFCFACQKPITYTDVSLHAADYKNNPDKCKICHGADWKGGISEKSCFSCHDSENIHPHAEGWGNITTHGVKYFGSKGLACQGACHGIDLKGGLSQVSCSNSDDVKCHSVWPHESSQWSSQHGASVLKADDSFDKNAFDLKCAGCHDIAEKMNTKMPSTTLKMPITNLFRCYFCHNIYPHLGFKDTIKGSDIDGGWGGGAGGGGHKRFLVYNEAYLTNAPGDDTASKISDLKTYSKGCGGPTAGEKCHANGRKGPFYPNTSDKNVCGALCHKTE